MKLRQAGAVPFRRQSDAFEFLIVTSKRGKWIFPKGIVEPGETLEEAAQKECREEAGVRGTIRSASIGSYSDRKWQQDCEVVIFLLEYEEDVDPWEERHMRERRWCSHEEASALLKSDALREILDAGVARLKSADA